jgi:hypothetical protein
MKQTIIAALLAFAAIAVTIATGVQDGTPANATSTAERMLKLDALNNSVETENYIGMAVDLLKNDQENSKINLSKYAHIEPYTFNKNGGLFTVWVDETDTGGLKGYIINIRFDVEGYSFSREIVGGFTPYATSTPWE